MPGSTYRQCPHCTERINCANRRCTKCGKLLAFKARQTARMGKFRAKAQDWAKKLQRSRNQSKVFDNSALMLEKLKALGYVPLLLWAKYKSGGSKWTAQLQCPFDFPSIVHGIFEKIILLFEGLLEAWNPEREHAQDRAEGNDQALGEGEEENEQAVGGEEENEQAVGGEEENEQAVVGGDEEVEEDNGQEEREDRMEIEPENAGQPKERQSEAGEMKEVVAEAEAKKDAEEREQDEGVMNKSAVKISAKKRKKKTSKGDDCLYHNAMEVFPVQYVSKHRERKGQKEVLVHWVPCPACKKVWPPSWEPQHNISMALLT